MKCVAILLACIVAVSATVTNTCPDASSAKVTYVPEPKVDSSVYCVNLKSKQEWFTTSYYLTKGDIKNFPEDGTKADCETEPAAGFVSGMEQKLKERLAEIVKEMNLQWTPDGFKEAIEAAHNDALNTYAQALATAGKAADAEAAKSLTEYTSFKAKLNLKLQSADLQFQCAVKRIESRLSCYHTQIISRFQQCISMRKCRVTSYENKMTERKTQMVNNYKKSLARVTEAKHAFVKKTLEALYKCDNDEFVAQKIAEKITQYKTNLEKCDKALWTQYETDLAKACKDMETTYKCEYRCTFNSGCYSFSRSSYTRNCVQFPKPKRVSYKLVGVSPFKATWKGGCIPTKKTCEPQTNADFKADEKKAKVTAEYKKNYDQGLKIEHEGWVAAINKWADEAPDKLRAILDGQTKKDCEGNVIEGWQAKAVEDAKPWIAMHKSRMLLEAKQIHDNGKCAMDMWVNRQNAAIDKLEMRYNECIKKKDTRKDCYLDQLDAREKCQKTQLENRLNCMINRSKIQFAKFLDCAGFNAFKTDDDKVDIDFDYTKVMTDAKDAILAEFTQWWIDYKAAVASRYTCGTKCTYRWSEPSMCFNFNYCMNPPCLTQYRNYC